MSAKQIDPRDGRWCVYTCDSCGKDLVSLDDPGDAFDAHQCHACSVMCADELLQLLEEHAP